MKFFRDIHIYYLWKRTIFELFADYDFICTFEENTYEYFDRNLSAT